MQQSYISNLSWAEPLWHISLVGSIRTRLPTKKWVPNQIFHHQTHLRHHILVSRHLRAHAALLGRHSAQAVSETVTSCVLVFISKVVNWITIKGISKWNLYSYMEIWKLQLRCQNKFESIAYCLLGTPPAFSPALYWYGCLLYSHFSEQ